MPAPLHLGRRHHPWRGPLAVRSTRRSGAMKGLLAVSIAAGRAPASHPPTAAGTRCLPDAASAVTHRFPDGWVTLTGPDPADRLPTGRRPALTVRLTRSSRGPDGDAGPDQIAGWLGDGTGAGPDGAALCGLLPPFAAAHRAGPDAPLVLAADWLGYRHLYWWQGDGAAAVSTSARALAVVAGAELDTAALGVQSLMGWQVGTATIFTGVSKLAPGCAAVLRGGRVEVRRYAGEPFPADGDGSPADLDAVVDEMAQILRELLTGVVADHPDTLLQLSGGQDSRLLLCALPPPLRKGLRAMTLDRRGGVESRVAARLAEACDLDHRIIWLDDRPPVDGPTGYGAALEAAAALDGMASPLALGPLLLIEADLEQGHRLGGAGGETARGFYYPGQPRHATTSAQLVRRLADWRLFTNEAVERDALDPDFAAGARTAALAAVGACFDRFDPDWLRATDEFYLWQRVQRWAGVHSSPVSVLRTGIDPLLDRRFMRLALTPAPADKRHSLLTGRLMHRLSPELAAIPLDSGLVPARLAHPGPGNSAAVARLTATKTARKVWQRLRRARRAQVGAAELGQLVLARWRAEPELLAPVRDTGLIRAAWLDEMLAGQRGTGPATLAFLVNLQVAAGATGAARVEAAAEAGSRRPEA